MSKRLINNLVEFCTEVKEILIKNYEFCILERTK
jgi:hypothetical protein